MSLIDPKLPMICKFQWSAGCLKADGDCTESLEQGVIAARWCDMSLTDTSNGIVGATETELFEVFARGVAVTVPSCNEMLAP